MKNQTVGMRCSFCGTPASDSVQVVVAPTRAGICASCIEFCKEVLEDESSAPAALGCTSGALSLEAIERHSEWLRACAHVVFGSVQADLLRQVGCANVAVLQDKLAIGPCRLDLRRHARDRTRFWKRVASPVDAPVSSPRDIAKSLQSANRLEIPIVVWLSPGWNEQIAFWRLCHILEHRDVALGMAYIVSRAAPRSRECLSTEFPFPSGRATFAEYVAAFPSEPLMPKPTRLTSRMVGCAASLWHAFTSPGPAALLKKARRGHRLVPELRWIGSYFGSLFPRVVPGHPQTVRIAMLDEVILRGLSTQEFRLPYDLVSGQRVDSTLRAYLALLGEAFICHRLCEWAGSPGAFLLARPADEGGRSPLWRNVYRLTPRGDELLRSATDNPEEIPALEIGGNKSYRGSPLHRVSLHRAGWQVHE